MTGFSWLVVTSAAASAGVYCGALAALASRRWAPGAIPLPGLLAATALFALSRYFAAAVPLSILSALFCTIAIAQIAAARNADASLKLLAIVPVIAMLLVSVGFQQALAATLCAPAPIALLLALRNLHLIRKTAFDRIA